ncbi:TPA: hypothetical protein ACX6RT_000824 [Photobacterium damselae]
MKQLSLLTLSIICAFSSLPVQANDNESANIASTSQLEVNEQAFSQLRQKWAEGFLGASDIAFDQKLKQMVITANNGAQKHWSSMNTASTRE